MKKILFILKKNHAYSFSYYHRRSSGLWNSVSETVKALREVGVHAHQVEVGDNNEIDREVFKFKPDKVVIEALWVVPHKFIELKKLHPKVKWYVHLHSNVPFLSQEGIAVEWIESYVHFGVGIIANAPQAYEAVKIFAGHKQHVYLLENIYLKEGMPMVVKVGDIEIACFGAIRPLKNTLLQAIAAIKFADDKKTNMKFHINSTRCESGGEPILKNLRNLFNKSRHSLIEHPWYEPEELMEVLPWFDLFMQCSLSETFNIVSADAITAGLPIVVSKEIPWASCWSIADPSSIDGMVKVMNRSYKNRCLVKRNQKLLYRYSKKALGDWYSFSMS